MIVGHELPLGKAMKQRVEDGHLISSARKRRPLAESLKDLTSASNHETEELGSCPFEP